MKTEVVLRKLRPGFKGYFLSGLSNIKIETQEQYDWWRENFFLPWLKKWFDGDSIDCLISKNKPDESYRGLSEHYSKLLDCLFYIPYEWSFPKDTTLYYWAADMVGECASVMNYDISDTIDYGRPSFLEFMVGVSYYNSQSIPPVWWLWSMIDSLYLLDMTNDNFIKDKVVNTIYNYYDGLFYNNGSNSPFYVSDRSDMNTSAYRAMSYVYDKNIDSFNESIKDKNYNYFTMKNKKMIAI